MQIKVGDTLQNNETGVLVTVVKTQDRYTNEGGMGIPPAAVKWVFYETPSKQAKNGKRLIRISADRIYEKRRHDGYTVVSQCA